MAANQSEIRGWFEDGISKGHTHMAVFYDTWDHEDFPSYYTGTSEEVRKLVANRNKEEFLRLMEVYDLKMDMNRQLAESRAFNY